MRKVKLTDICSPKQWKTIPTEQLTEDGYPVYGANGIIGKYPEYNHDVPVIAITCRGATCGKINLTQEKSYVTGNAMCLDNLRSDVDLEYLFYALRHYDFSTVISGSAQPQITRQGLRKVTIPLVAFEKQKFIAKTLAKAERIMSHYQAQLSKLDELVKCRFVEMFGDMIYNPNKWEEKALQSVADIVSGITKGRKISDTKLIEVPYMSVCNVKDGYIDWTNLKTILATNKEIEQYRILANDVLMTEGGDPDKVGRGAIISSPPNNCIHQNHIFRVRLSEEVEAIYFEQYLQQPKARQYFYRSAKQTTGIASINMSQLKAMPVLLPPLALQEQFADFVRRIDKLRFVIRQSLDETQKLFDSLMQEYFD